MQNNVGQTQINQQTAPIAVTQTNPIQQGPVTQPASVNSGSVGQSTNIPIPNYSGVNIQIFNPSVSAPGGTSPTYNVNSPVYTPYYGPDYYTKQMGNVNQNGDVSGANGQGANTAGVVNGTSGVNGANAANTQNAQGQQGSNAVNAQNAQGQQGSNVANSQNSTQSTTNSDKNTEKRNIVLLTDDYIKNLENYLNSKDKEVRMMGAKQVIERLSEDPSRKDDKALNILIDKMLQDPSEQIKILAMGALDSRLATGDEYAVKILKNMQNSKDGYGQDALQASDILLKMSGKTVQKEVEVPVKKETKTETKQETTSKETK